MRMIANLLSETKDNRIISLKVLKEKNYQSKILYPGEIAFKNEGKITILWENKSWDNSLYWPIPHLKKCKESSAGWKKSFQIKHHFKRRNEEYYKKEIYEPTF